MTPLIALLSSAGWAQSGDAPPIEGLSESWGPRMQVSVEVGTLGNRDAAYDLFADGNQMPSRGVRVGYRVLERLEVFAGWHHLGRGSVVQLDSPTDTEADFATTRSEFVAAFTAEEFTLGPRVDISIEDRFYPYASAALLVVRGLARLDDAPNSSANIGQIRAAGVGAGLLAMGGAEIRIPVVDDWHVALHAELGYGWVSPIGLGDLGQMQPGGVAGRGGVGIRF
ncbi:MAG: hypothetical protein KTR31_36070 [Myxococcales bacterium]|nr:hypothetical protein [Myxococcales bacterium]